MLSSKLQHILSRLDEDELKSVLFLLIDIRPECGFCPENFIFVIKKQRHEIESQIHKIFNFFSSEESLLAELLTVMQKYNLLNLVGLCSHLMKKDESSFTQIKRPWKYLYTVCEQLTDSEVNCMKSIWFPRSRPDQVYSAEELFCMMYLQKKPLSVYLQSLIAFFHDFKPSIEQLLSNETSPQMNFYPIRRPTLASKCGIAVILNNEIFPNEASLPRRVGSLKDVDALKELWDSFGFITQIYTDLTQKETEELFENLSKIDHSSYDIFIACIMSHGDEGILYSSDSKPIQIQELIDIIANNTPSLVDKPKLFFIQACQGSLVQHGWNQLYDPLQNSAAKLNQLDRPLALNLSDAPRSADVLKFLSTISGFVSFRHVEHHSWFIEELIKVIKEHGETLSMASIVTKVTESVTQKRGSLEALKNCKQTPINESTLRRELKLKKMLL